MIKQISTKSVYKNQWMNVREDEVEFADGGKGIFGVVEKPDFSMIVPFDGSHFYLVEQYRYPIKHMSLEFPQGSHETNPSLKPEELANAELEEETGYQARRMEEIGYLYEAPGYCNQGFHIFLATELIQSQQNLDQSEVGMQVKKCSVTEFETLVRDGTIKDGPTLSAFALLKIKKIL